MAKTLLMNKFYCVDSFLDSMNQLKHLRKLYRSRHQPNQASDPWSNYLITEKVKHDLAAPRQNSQNMKPIANLKLMNMAMVIRLAKERLYYGYPVHRSPPYPRKKKIKIK